MSETSLLFTHKKNCCGCGACANLCPVDAITMREDEYGYLYPDIDPLRCIDCGQCSNVCPLHQKQPSSDIPIAAYVAVMKDKNALVLSASGGVFSAIAENILQSGGCVFGCCLDLRSATVSHIKVERPEQLDCLKGSKYMQSSIGFAYRQAKDAAENGQTVLFSGTPCQIAGLKAFFGGQLPDHCYTIDLVCHGTPPQRLFFDYIQYIEKKQQIRIENFSFRCWGLQCRMDGTDGNGKRFTDSLEPNLSSYYTFFLQGETYRDCCYSCPYAGSYRPADISIGDYWGIDLVHPELLSSNGGPVDQCGGVSCLLVNNEHGRKLLSQFGSSLSCYPSTWEQVSRYNRQLNTPSTHTALRHRILSAYRDGGYAAVEQLFIRQLGLRYPIRKMKHYLRKYIKANLTERMED